MNCPCGKGVRLRAYKIRVNRKPGVAHYLEHVDGTKPCVAGTWDCASFKPYPKNDADTEWSKMTARFREATLAALEEGK